MTDTAATLIISHGRIRDFGFAYEAELTTGEEYWTHDKCGLRCGREYNTSHSHSCQVLSGFLDCTYHFGDDEVRRAIEFGRTHGEDAPMPNGLLTAGILRLLFPDLISANIPAQ